jgi:putative membrane protein
MNVTKTFGRLAGVAALLLATGAVHSAAAQVKDSTEMKNPAAQSGVTVDTKTNVTLSDSAVIAMLQVANTQQVAAADLAIRNGNSEEVKEFARTLKADHQAALDKLSALSSQLATGPSNDRGMAAGMPADSARPMANPDERKEDITDPGAPNAKADARADVHADADAGFLSSLEALKGHEFDHGFVRLEINEHKKEIEYLQNEVLPKIENPELKQAIQSTIPTLQDHLQKAVDLEKMLGKTSG